MRAVESHPPEEDLQAFALGSLDDAWCQPVEAHLQDCPACQARAARLPADSLIDLLRCAHARMAAPADTPTILESDATLICERPADGLAPPTELTDHPRYRLLRPLGTGGMGTVWLAEHKMMRRQVALKVIRSEFLARADAADRFQREVHVAAHLHHPNIVAAHDAERAGATHFLVMEYVAGESLAEHLKRTGPLTTAEACRLAGAVALGLQHAHEHGLVHRDIKPHNLMLTTDGVVKILDFGLAAFVSGSVPASGLTGVNMVVGTPDYIAPEQAEDARAADIRSDIYSLGCTLYEMLTGRVPFPGDSTLRKLDAQRTREPEPLGSLCPDVPEELAAVLARMMAKDPADRYQTPAEVADALEPFASENAPRPRRRKHWMAAAEAVLLAVVCLAVAVGVVFRIQTDEGEVVITPQSPDVEIVLLQNGRTIRVIDTKTQKRVTVPVGSYDVVLKDRPKGIELKTEKITISRGREELVRIEQVAPSRAGISAREVRRGRKEQAGPSSRKIAEVRQIEWPDVHVHRVAFSPDGRLYAAGGDSGTVRVWEVVSGKLLQEFIGHEDMIGGVAFTSDSKQLLSGAADATLRLWDVASGQAVRTWPGHTGLVVGVAVSPDGRWAVSGAHDRTLRLWELATGREMRKLEGHEDVSDGMFSADSKQILSWSGDRSVRLWDVASGKQLHLYQGHTGWIWGAYFLDGGRQMASWSGEDHTVRVWDIAREKEVRRHALKRQKLEGLDVSPDGRTYLAAYHDQTVCLYDMATGKELAVTRAVNVPDVLTISPDGRYAAAGSYRGLVHLWRLPNEPAASSEP